jgi:hypothetical protein
MPGEGGKADAPRRSREQRLRALQQANEIRSARAQLKRDLASGKIELARILARPPEFAQTAKVLDLLLFLPKVGPVKAGRMLAQCRIAHSKTLDGLSERQRAALIDLFRGRGRERGAAETT